MVEGLLPDQHHLLLHNSSDPLPPAVELRSCMHAHYMLQIVCYCMLLECLANAGWLWVSEWGCWWRRASDTRLKCKTVSGETVLLFVYAKNFFSWTKNCPMLLVFINLNFRILNFHLSQISCNTFLYLDSVFLGRFFPDAVLNECVCTNWWTCHNEQGSSKSLTPPAPPQWSCLQYVSHSQSWTAAPGPPLPDPHPGWLLWG